MTNKEIISSLRGLIGKYNLSDDEWQTVEQAINVLSNSDEDRKALIHKILEQGYINFATRLNYDIKIQESTISQNRGLKFACCSIIEGSSNEEELYEYFKREILRIENSGEQQVSIKEWKKE